MPDEQPTLSRRHERFVHEYLVDYNATQAAIRTGYSPRTARQQASRLMARTDVLTRLKECQQKLYEQVGESKCRLLQRLENLVDYDIRELFDEKNGIRDFRYVSPAALSAIKSFVVRRRHGNDSTGEPLRDIVISVTFHDRLKALELMMQYQGLLDTKQSARCRINLGEVLREARHRENIAR